MVGCNKSNLAHLGSMAEWFKHETVNFGNRGPNHHAMTEHFGSRNKNSTRRYRYSKNK